MSLLWFLLFAVPILLSADPAGFERHLISPGNETRVVRILHISDTHNMHRGIEGQFQLPPADILIHTGDVGNLGKDEEFADFNAWLGELKGRYPHILAISGNHDFMGIINQVERGQVPPEAALAPDLMQHKLSNARVLNHESVDVLGLRIFGSSWCPWFGYWRPGDAERMEWSPARKRIWQAWQQQPGSRNGSTHRYGDIPAGVDILLTHGPAYGIFDQTLHNGQWGSSSELQAAIHATKPKLHLFGHVHEQRGQWLKQPDGKYQGGVEYHPNRQIQATFKPGPPPGETYPVTLVSNNAMANNVLVDFEVGHSGGPQHLVGPVRLITATRQGTSWDFAAAPLL